MKLRTPLTLLLSLPGSALVLGLAATLAANTYRTAAQTALGDLAVARQTAVAGPTGRAVGILIQGETAGLAQSALQALVRQRLAETGLVPDQLDPASTEPAAALTRISLTLGLSGTETQIMAAVLELDRGDPLLVLDRIVITGQGVEGGVLQAEIALSGFAAGFLQ